MISREAMSPAKKRIKIKVKKAARAEMKDAAKKSAEMAASTALMFGLDKVMGVAPKVDNSIPKSVAPKSVREAMKNK